MSPDHDSPVVPDAEPDEELFEDEGPPSIFRSTWVRAVLVVLGVALVSAVAVPYVLDAVAPPPSVVAVSTAPAKTPAPAGPVPPVAAPAAAPEPVAAITAPEKSAATPEPKASTPPAATPRTGATATVKAAPARVAKTAATDASADTVSRERVRASTVSTRPAEATEAAKGGDFFVQVGAFKDQETARRLAATLRKQNYSVEELTMRDASGRATPSVPPAPRTSAGAGSDRYDVLVSGGSAAEIDTKLAAKGLSSQPAGEGVRIRPSLSLRDAVALSKDLSNEGFKVQVRRGDGASAGPVAAAAPARAGDQKVYRVRVGGYPDRAAALAVVRALEGKGYTPFIARGRE